YVSSSWVILHVIDMGAAEGRDPYDDYLSINHELETYDLKLMDRPQIIVANKMDMPEAEENLKEFLHQMKEAGDDSPVFAISAYTKQGLKPLMEATAELLERTPAFPLYDPEEENVIYRYEPVEEEVHISRDDEGTWILTGDKLLKLFHMTNLEHDESIMRFARQLRSMGVDEKLREKGAKNGDFVRIETFEFEFVD